MNKKKYEKKLSKETSVCDEKSSRNLITQNSLLYPSIHVLKEFYMTLIARKINEFYSLSRSASITFWVIFTHNCIKNVFVVPIHRYNWKGKKKLRERKEETETKKKLVLERWVVIGSRIKVCFIMKRRENILTGRNRKP